VTAALPEESIEPAIQPVAGEGTTTSADHDAAATESPAATLDSTADAPAASDSPADDSPLVESTSTRTPTAPVAGSGQEAPPGSTAGGTSRQASPAPRTVPRVAVVDPQAAAQVANEQRVAAEGYRQRADRLLDRARRQWEAGHREEALRLAQIAHRLELAQKAVYRPDEESPSRFIATLQSAAVGDTLPRPPAATSPAATHVATPALASSDTPQAEPANVPSSDTPASRGPNAGTTDLVAESPTAIDTAPSVNAPAVEQLTGSHRFHRAAHRQPAAGELTVVPSSAALAEFERLAQLEATPAGEESATGASPAAPAPEETDAPELRDLPLELTTAATPPAGLTWLSPRVRWWLTWNRLSFLGLLTGLACLLVLWIWRELERWHHRGLQRAGLVS